MSLAVTGGSGPYTWTLMPGTYLPAGLTLTTAGALVGSPTTAGQYQFTAKVTDSASHVTFANFSVSIYPAGMAPPPGFTSGPNYGTFSIGQVDGNIRLTASGGDGTYVFSVTGGALPPGMSIRKDPPSWFTGPPDTTWIIGVATTPGLYPFQLAVTSAGQTTYQSATIRISSLVVKDLYSPPDVFVGQFFSHQLTAMRDGAQVSATWTPNGPMPTGITLSSAGLLSGTPSAQGSPNINFSVNDGTDTVYRNVTLNVYTINITTSGDVLPNAIQNTFYSTPALTTTGGSGTYTYSVSLQGPANSLNLNANAATGVLSGTINANAGTGAFSYTITATDTSMPPLQYSKRFTINVVGAVPVLPQVTNDNNLIADCTIGVPCNRTFSVRSGGRAPFTWTATGLPPGMDIQSGSGNTSSNVNPTQVELWGTPTSAGAYNVTLTVTDATGASASNTFPLYVSVLMTTNGLSNGTLETSYTSRLRVIGGNPGYTAALVSGPLPNGLTVDGPNVTVSGTPHENGNFGVTLKLHRLDRQRAGHGHRLLHRQSVEHQHQQQRQPRYDDGRVLLFAGSLRLLRAVADMVGRRFPEPAAEHQPLAIRPAGRHSAGWYIGHLHVHRESSQFGEPCQLRTAAIHAHRDAVVDFDQLDAAVRECGHAVQRGAQCDRRHRRDDVDGSAVQLPASGVVARPGAGRRNRARRYADAERILLLHTERGRRSRPRHVASVQRPDLSGGCLSAARLESGVELRTVSSRRHHQHSVVRRDGRRAALPLFAHARGDGHSRHARAGRPAAADKLPAVGDRGLHRRRDGAGQLQHVDSRHRFGRPDLGSCDHAARCRRCTSCRRTV